MKTNRKQQQTTTTAEPAPNIMVFDRTQAICDAIIAEAGLDPSKVEIVLAGADNSGWREAGQFEGIVYTTQNLGQRVSMPTIRLPLWPRVNVPKAVAKTDHGRRLAAKLRKEAWDKLNSPDCEMEFITAAMDEPRAVLHFELTKTNNEVWDSYRDVFETAGPEVAAAFKDIESLLGHPGR